VADDDLRRTLYDRQLAAASDECRRAVDAAARALAQVRVSLDAGGCPSTHELRTLARESAEACEHGRAWLALVEVEPLMPGGSPGRGGQNPKGLRG
jgi:hypothetical protein